MTFSPSSFQIQQAATIASTFIAPVCHVTDYLMTSSSSVQIQEVDLPNVSCSSRCGSIPEQSWPEDPEQTPGIEPLDVSIELDDKHYNLWDNRWCKIKEI